ncbi:MAG: TonB-dependent receptor [Sphingobium sp.]
MIGLAMQDGALAQSPQATDRMAGQPHVGDIVVTAQRRNQRLQDVPIAVAAVSGEQLQARGITSTESLAAAVPGLTVTTAGPSGKLFIRGIGADAGDPANEPSVATYIDGVYVAAPSAAIFEFNSVEQIEVLKGPQGTLFGRNATGGVVLIRTRDPSFDASASAEIGYANYDTFTANAYVTAPLSDTVAFNLAGQFRDQGDGFGRNLVRGDKTYVRDDLSIRGKLLFQPSDATKIVLAGDYDRLNTSGNDYQGPQGTVGADGQVIDLRPYDTVNGEVSRTNIRNYGGSLTIEQDLGFASLKSISAYRRVRGPQNKSDLDKSPAPIALSDLVLTQRSYSQELHLASNGSGPFTWLAGAYYFDTTAGYDPAGFDGTDFGIRVDVTGLVYTKSLAAFAQGTYALTPELNVTAGFRYTWDRQKHRTMTESPLLGVLVPWETDRQRIQKPTWRLAVDYKFTPNILGYMSYNRGVKSGGYSPLEAASSPLDNFAPERLDAYEAGFKTDLINRQLRFNLSAFWYEYKNIQVFITKGASSYTESGGAARIKGFDMDLQAAPSDRLTFTAGIAYTDGKYTDFDNATAYLPTGGAASIVNATGNRTVNTPKWTVNSTINYAVPLASGTLAFSGSAAFTDKYFFTADNRAMQDDVLLLNSRIRWESEDEKLSLSVWGRNLTDERYYAGFNISNYGDLIQFSAPRTYGITVGTRF